eukprot:6140836-Prymnesium_polylepis.1
MWPGGCAVCGVAECSMPVCGLVVSVWSGGCMAHSASRVGSAESVWRGMDLAGQLRECGGAVHLVEAERLD